MSTQAARRALAHIRARTITGRFACPLYDMPTRTWDGALAELRQAGYPDRLDLRADRQRPHRHRRLRARRPTRGVGAMNAPPAAGRGLAGPDDRRRCAPADRADRAPDPQGPTPVPSTFYEQLVAAERARRARVRRLWQMTPEQRVAAMRRGELSYEQLAAWSARYADQVPLVNCEFEWIAMREPEACE